jgi:hypothetical protein
MLEETQDQQEVIARIAALDIGKAELVCCARLPSSSGSGNRVQEVTTYSTMTRSLQLMADRLLELGVTRVVMEATSDYWKSPFYLLEAHGFEVWLVNAKDVKHLPGRPKTDMATATWPACSAKPPSPLPEPTLSSASVTAGSLGAEARSGPWSRSAGPSWSSSGNCCPTPTPSSTTSAPTSTTPGWAPNAPSATTSSTWKPSATKSPSNPPPDRPTSCKTRHGSAATLSPAR